MQIGPVAGLISSCFVSRPFVCSRTMKLRETTKCSDGERFAKRLQKLDARIAELEKQNAELQAQNAKRQEELAKARKDSSTSSKPPSSDIVNPDKKTAKGKRRRGKRKQGGQPGHAKHERPQFPPEMLDNTWEYHLSECPVCGDALLPADEAPRTIQQVEIVAKPIRIDEHRGLAYWCESCQQVHYAPLPPEVQKGGLFGPELTAVVAYMKGICHASFSTIRKFLRDVLGVTVSRGYPDLLKREDALLRVARYDGDHCIGRSWVVMLDEPHQIAVMLEDCGFADETNIPRRQLGQVRA